MEMMKKCQERNAKLYEEANSAWHKDGQLAMKMMKLQKRRLGCGMIGRMTMVMVQEIRNSLLAAEIGTTFSETRSSHGNVKQYAMNCNVITAICPFVI
ncbi:PP2A regulatory subunit [Asimina triloba]